MAVMVGRVGYAPLHWLPVRCDRNVHSPFMNPFTRGSRDDKCDAFHTYFLDETKRANSPISVAYARLRRKHNSGQNITLQCHCAGIGRCHTETIKKKLEEDYVCTS